MSLFARRLLPLAVSLPLAGTHAVLTAYDSQGNVPGIEYAGESECRLCALRGILSLTTAAPIHSFSILPNHSNDILGLDNLRLTTAEVPEPGQWALFR